MKVLFLDMDGVLNIMSRTYYSHSYLELGSDPIEKHLMVRLEFILDRVPDARIVISSSWHEKQVMKRLTQARFKYLDRIIGRTPRDVNYRGNQIAKWLETNKVDNYIVIEDEVFDVCGSKCNVIRPEYVIKVDSNEGLSHKNTIESVVKLNNLDEYDRNIDEFTLVNYFSYYDKGYRAQVGIPEKDGKPDYDKLESDWDNIAINNKSLHMVLSKKVYYEKM